MAEEKIILEMTEAIKEKLELRRYDQKRGAQYQILSIDGKEIPKKYILLIGFEQRITMSEKEIFKELTVISEEKMKIDPNQYFGEINIFLCKKKISLLKKDSLEMMKHIRKLYTVKQWIENSKKISLLEALK